MEHGEEGMEEEFKTGSIPKGRRMKRYRPPFINPPLQLDRSCSQANDTPSRVVDTSYSVVDEHFAPPSSSSSHHSLWEHTEEEQAVASYLLLLSNYHESPRNVTSVNEVPPVQFVETKPKSLSSKIISPNGTVFYRCNICGRDFRSFQALGGHRASHKKLRSSSQPKNEPINKISMDETRSEYSGKTNIVESKEIKEVGEEQKVDEEDMLKLSMNFLMDANKARVHQCTMCGSEFTSGQALGGHMRRHRNPAMALVDATSSGMVGQDFYIKEEDDEILKENSSPLALDLNLPAPSTSEEKRATTPEG